VADGGEVKITNNTSIGVLLNSITVWTYDAQGIVITQHPVTSSFDLPRFLAPGSRIRSCWSGTSCRAQ
jgi:hypothetical protein